MTWSNAGHLPPIVVRPDGSTVLLATDRPDLLLGVDPHFLRRRDHTADLHPGSTVLLYTDGLVERRDADLDDGIHRLRVIIAGLAHVSPDEICDAVLDPTTAPVAVAAGAVSFVASHMGWRTHELVVLPLAEWAVAGRGVPGGDGGIDEAGRWARRRPTAPRGAGDGIASGQIGWVTPTLKPGRYELVCNLPNHYADGKFAELLVS